MSKKYFPSYWQYQNNNYQKKQKQQDIKNNNNRKKRQGTQRIQSNKRIYFYITTAAEK